jgi:hypothetical protein
MSNDYCPVTVRFQKKVSLVITHQTLDIDH